MSCCTRSGVPSVAISSKPSCRHNTATGGPRLTALNGELSGPQGDSRSMVQERCRSVLGVAISRGAIQRAVDWVSDAITPHDEAVAEQASRAPVNSIDETTWYQHGVLAWLWVMVNAMVA